ncbi:MAG: nucleotide exchange factor GrpE [Kocuria sp.]|nr:nucleotide exchange factor GrpE [Kocuria sp.]
MSASSEEPHDAEQGDQPEVDYDVQQDAELTVDEILGTEQTGQARAADQDAPATDDDVTPDLAQVAEDRLEDLRRLQAEFVNYKNRTERERTALRDHVISDVLGSLLPVFDDIDAARAAGDLTDGPFAAIATKLEDLLAKQGLERLGEIGEAFDPSVHEAVLQQPADGVESDHISMVLRSGFRVGARVVRAAQVAVAP